MTTVQKTMVAVALAAFSAGSVYAQSSGSGSSGGGSAGGGGVTATSSTFQDWLNAHGAKNNGRISRQAYMDEAGRRWDSADKSKQGLTLAEIRGVYNPPAVMGGPTATNPQERKGISQ
jgi:hypothetical protein